MLPSPVGKALGPAHTPGQRAGAGALGPKEVGPVARALPALQRCILGGWVWSSLCLKRFPHGVLVVSLTVQELVASRTGAVTLGSRKARAAPSMRSHGGCLARKLFLILGSRRAAGSWGGQGPRLAWGASSPSLALGDSPEGPGSLAPSPGSSGICQRQCGTRPAVCPEAPPGKEPPERLGLQAFLMERSPCHSHS